jgi:hypothetical protein
MVSGREPPTAETGQTESERLVRRPRTIQVVNAVRTLENPVVRWAIAVLYLGTSLTLLIVVGDLPEIDQIVVTITCVIGFFVVPIALKGYVDSAPDQY